MLFAKSIHRGNYSWINLMSSSITSAKRHRLNRWSLKQTYNDRKFIIVTKRSYISLNKFKYFKETSFFFKIRHVTSPKTLTYAFSIQYISSLRTLTYVFSTSIKIIWRPLYFSIRRLWKKIASMVNALVHIVQPRILSLEKLKENDDINET